MPVFHGFWSKEKINKILTYSIQNFGWKKYLICGYLPHKVRTRCTKYNGFLLEQEANNTKSFTLVRGVPSALAVVGVGTVLAQVMLV